MQYLIQFLPADEGNATVIMNTCDYDRRLTDILADETDKPMYANPTTYQEKLTRTKIFATPIDQKTRKHFKPREKLSGYPKFNG